MSRHEGSPPTNAGEARARKRRPSQPPNIRGESQEPLLWPQPNHWADLQEARRQRPPSLAWPPHHFDSRQPSSKLRNMALRPRRWVSQPLRHRWGAVTGIWRSSKAETTGPPPKTVASEDRPHVQKVVRAVQWRTPTRSVQRLQEAARVKLITDNNLYFQCLGPNH